MLFKPPNLCLYAFTALKTFCFVSSIRIGEELKKSIGGSMLQISKTALTMLSANRIDEFSR